MNDDGWIRRCDWIEWSDLGRHPPLSFAREREKKAAAGEGVASCEGGGEGGHTRGVPREGGGGGLGV